MAQNIFDATYDANNRIDVNSFDWSHVNNLTTNFGRITPVFCELVPAKGSLRINPEFGLELMPLPSPVPENLQFLSSRHTSNVPEQSLLSRHLA